MSEKGRSDLGESDVARVLIVDDQQINIDVLRQVLAPLKLELHEALGGTDALRLLLKHEYACCLLDLRMPEVNGFQVAEYIRRDAKIQHLPIIFVTAEAADQQTMFEGYDKGAVDYLIKPIEPKVIRSKVAIFAELFRYHKVLQRKQEIENLNAKLEMVNEELQIANDDLRHFTQLAAHDFREPIRSQRNLLALLREEITKPLSQITESLLSSLDGGLERMVALTDDFRALTQVDYKELQRYPTDLKALIENCVNQYADQISLRKVKVKYDKFPKSILVYPSLVSHLYDRMVQNFLDHTQLNGLTLHFTAEEISEENWVFGVLNTGSTIENEFRSEVFKMRRKFDSQHEKGEGVGLAICKRIIERHHGKITLEVTDNSVHFKFTF